MTNQDHAERKANPKKPASSSRVTDRMGEGISTLYWVLQGITWLGLLLCVGLMPFGRVSAFPVQAQIEPGQMICTTPVLGLAPDRSIRVDVDVLTMAGVSVDPQSAPLVLSIGTLQSNGTEFQPNKLLLQGPILPSVFPTREAFLLEYLQFGEMLDGRRVSTCILNPNGNPAYRLSMNQSVIEEAATVSPGNSIDLSPQFMNGRAIISCCRPGGDASSCLRIEADPKSRAFPEVCPSGLRPVL